MRRPDRLRCAPDPEEMATTWKRVLDACALLCGLLLLAGELGYREPIMALPTMIAWTPVYEIGRDIGRFFGLP